MNTSTKRIFVIAAVAAVLIAATIGVCCWLMGSSPSAPAGDGQGATNEGTSTTDNASDELSTSGTSSTADPSADGSGKTSFSASTTSDGTTDKDGSNTSQTTSTGGSSSSASSQSVHTSSTTTGKDAPSTTTTSRPTSVTLPTQKDPETGEMGITFPCAVPGYDLVIEKLAPYQGMFVEDGSNVQVSDVAMLLLHNEGDQPLEFGQITVEYEGESLLFEVSALPAGERAVVQEKTRKPVPDKTPKASSALVVHRASLEMSSEQVSVKDNGNNTLTIRNLTNQTLSTVRVFYKYYIEDQDVFVGGIAFTMRLTRLGAGASVTVQPSHYTSDTSRVVMVLTYDE